MRKLATVFLAACALLMPSLAASSSVGYVLGPRSPLAADGYIGVYGFQIRLEGEDRRVIEAFDAFFAAKHLPSEHKSNDDQIDVQIDAVTRLSLLLFVYGGEPDRPYYVITLRVKPNPAPFSEPGKQYLRELRLHMLEAFPGMQTKYPRPIVSDFGQIRP